MNNEIIRLEKVSRVFSDGTVALNNVNLSFLQGEFTVVCGRNGSGKSVLMSLIASLDEATSGTVTVNSSVGLVFQNADSQILGETPEEDILFGLKNLGIKKQESSLIIESVLKKCGLYEKRQNPARLLSGGEKRRLAVAGILALKRDVIIFDEPFANLDFPGVQDVCNILFELKKENKTVIVLTHELEKILGLAERFVILEKGSVVFDGSVSLGLKQNLENWGIKNPLSAYKTEKDLYWGTYSI